MEIEIFGYKFSLFVELRQWEKFINVLNKYFFCNPVTIIAVFLLLTIVVVMLNTAHVSGYKKKILSRGCLVAYIFVLFLLFIVCRPSGIRGIRTMNKGWYISGGVFHESNVLITLINIILFVPFGVLLEKTIEKNHKTIICTIIITALLIEILQFILSKGFSAIQDVLAYVFGAVLGWLLVYLLDKQ